MKKHEKSSPTAAPKAGKQLKDKKPEKEIKSAAPSAPAHSPDKKKK